MTREQVLEEVVGRANSAAYDYDCSISIVANEGEGECFLIEMWNEDYEDEVAAQARVRLLDETVDDGAYLLEVDIGDPHDENPEHHDVRIIGASGVTLFAILYC